MLLESLKYSGKDNSIKLKLPIFYDFYSKSNIFVSDYHKAFSIMLKDQALAFYYTDLIKYDLNFT